MSEHRLKEERINYHKNEGKWREWKKDTTLN
jgi:hypothetical protein